jgi:hypothetical protein
MTSDPHLDAELGALRRTLSKTRSAANRMVWRAATQRRSSAIARLLRVLPRLVLAPTVDRTKGPTGWFITATGIDGASQLVLEIMSATAARTIEQLAEPIRVQVHHSELVDIVRLERLRHDGNVTVGFVEAQP